MPKLQSLYSVTSMNLTKLYENMSKKSCALMGCCAYFELYKEKLENLNLNKFLFTTNGLNEMSNYGRIVGNINIILRFLMSSNSEINLNSSLNIFSCVFNQIYKLFNLYESFYYSLKAIIIPTIQNCNVFSIKTLININTKILKLLSESTVLFANVSSSQLKYCSKEGIAINNLYNSVINCIENNFKNSKHVYNGLINGIVKLFNCINEIIENIDCNFISAEYNVIRN